MQNRFTASNLYKYRWSKIKIEFMAIQFIFIVIKPQSGFIWTKASALWMFFRTGTSHEEILHPLTTKIPILHNFTLKSSRVWIPWTKLFADIASSKRKYRRWPVHVFFTLVDFGVYVAFQMYVPTAGVGISKLSLQLSKRATEILSSSALQGWLWRMRNIFARLYTCKWIRAHKL